LDAWDRQDPVDNWERERERRIAEITGTGNPHIFGAAANPTAKAEPISCTMNVKQCQDDSFVNRVVPHWEFPPCPDTAGAYQSGTSYIVRR